MAEWFIKHVTGRGGQQRLILEFTVRFVMSTTTYRGVVRGNSIVLSDPDLHLADGTVVVVTPLELIPGTGAAILAAVKASPEVTAEDVDELERMMDSEQRPLSPPPNFE